MNKEVLIITLSGVKDGVLYIHTTYLDNINNLDESFLREAENTRKYDPLKYQRDFLRYVVKF
jgi:phage terminase large subunit